MSIPYLNQILLFLVVTVLATLLSLVGIQVIHILKELRETAKKTNKILDDFQSISSSIAKPIVGISGFITGLRSGTDLINLFLKKKTAAELSKGEKNG